MKAVALLVALAPALAIACPACAARADGAGPVGWAVAAMIAAPIAVGAVLFVIARRLQRGS